MYNGGKCPDIQAQGVAPGLPGRAADLAGAAVDCEHPATPVAGDHAVGHVEVEAGARTRRIAPFTERRLDVDDPQHPGFGHRDLGADLGHLQQHVVVQCAVPGHIPGQGTAVREERQNPARRGAVSGLQIADLDAVRVTPHRALGVDDVAVDAAVAARDDVAADVLAAEVPVDALPDEVVAVEPAGPVPGDTAIQPVEGLRVALGIKATQRPVGDDAAQFVEGQPEAVPVPGRGIAGASVEREGGGVEGGDGDALQVEFIQGRSHQSLGGALAAGGRVDRDTGDADVANRSAAQVLAHLVLDETADHLAAAAHQAHVVAGGVQPRHAGIVGRVEGEGLVVGLRLQLGGVLDRSEGETSRHGARV